MSFPIPKLIIYITELHDLYELVQNMLLLMGLCKDKVDNDNLDMFVLSIRQIMSHCLNSFQHLPICSQLLLYYTWILSVARYLLLLYRNGLSYGVRGIYHIYIYVIFVSL